MKERILLDPKGKRFFFKGKDIHTKDGYIRASAIEQAKDGDVLVSNKDVAFKVLPVSFIDKYWKIKRSAQIIPLKDLGFLAAELGMGADWTVVDAGAGSGGAASFFGRICAKGKVHTYDIRDDHIAIVKENIAFFDLKNVTVKKHDITTGIPVKNVDLVLLDIPNPWDAAEHAFGALKVGGYVVSYSPTIPQVMDFVSKVRSIEGLQFLKTAEIAERNWDVLGRKVRPKSQSIGHSGFLSIARKVGTE